MSFDDHGYVCPFNEECRCQIADCDTCGWNPVVSEKRLERILKELGIERREPEVRLINAVDLEARIRAVVTPLLDVGFSPWQIFAEVMKCIAAAETVETENVIHCKECSYGEMAKANCRKGNPENLTCHNPNSPCNRRNVSADGYCPYGERRLADGNQ